MKAAVYFISALCASALAPITSVAAQDQPAMPRAEVQAVLDCRAIADISQRVACYDRETAVLDQALNDGTVVVLNEDDRRTARRNLFGFTLPKIDFLNGDDDQSGEELLRSTVTSVSQTGRKQFRMTIADGDAVWEIRNAPSRLNPPRVGQEVEFEKAALNSYWVRINGQIGVKGVRIR